LELAREASDLFHTILELEPHGPPEEADWFDSTIRWYEGDRVFHIDRYNVDGQNWIYLYTIRNTEHPNIDNEIRFVMTRKDHANAPRRTWSIRGDPFFVMLLALTHGWVNKWEGVEVEHTVGYNMYKLDSRERELLVEAIKRTLYRIWEIYRVDYPIGTD
jgi:hypothetical protein